MCIQVVERVYRSQKRIPEVAVIFGITVDRNKAGILTVQLVWCGAVIIAFVRRNDEVGEGYFDGHRLSICPREFHNERSVDLIGIFAENLIVALIYDHRQVCGQLLED